MSRTNGSGRRAPLHRVAATIFWSFFGVRRSKDRDQDAVRITPVQVIIGGLVGAAVFVATLLIVVYFVTR
jgi:Protein of unknown function (DUF2970)